MDHSLACRGATYQSLSFPSGSSLQPLGPLLGGVSLGSSLSDLSGDSDMLSPPLIGSDSAEHLDNVIKMLLGAYIRFDMDGLPCA